MVFYDVHTHKSLSDEKVLQIENKFPNSVNFSSPFSIGIHPWFINKNTYNKELLIVEDKLQHANCYAIGECGLDKLKGVALELQKEVFLKQVELSEKYKKPLIIHCVKAFQEIIAIKKELQPKQFWMLHGFNKNIHLAKSLIDHNFMLSFGELVLKNKKIEETLRQINLSSFLIETDDSDVNVKDIYQKIADIRNVKVVILQNQIKQNFKRIFTK
ncbi:TatD family hydrolase [Polaribacter sp. Z022]|uniref:TatD family hydrolase n=1 Tax=Polaribacter sp. Z022 TaxID=2927125 RepID=UPI00201FE6D1|nr:TatD family hydrolase [Polaribacter sp. Z022]MCL7754479.1 TatD family hydrolase [Polaribacter sp. Z022]